jgi:hypothetical protein
MVNPSVRVRVLRSCNTHALCLTTKPKPRRRQGSAGLYTAPDNGRQVVDCWDKRSTRFLFFSFDFGCKNEVYVNHNELVVDQTIRTII